MSDIERELTDTLQHYVDAVQRAYQNLIDDATEGRMDHYHFHYPEVFAPGLLTTVYEKDGREVVKRYVVEPR